MKPRTVALFPVLCLVMVLGLLVSGCTPAAAPTPEPAVPAPKAAAPAATPKPAAGQPESGGVLTFWLTHDQPSMDPNQETTIFQQMLCRPVYSTLLRLDPTKLPDDEVIIGDLAEKWEVSNDGKTLTFQLRKGVKFHDGSPLTSEDVKFTFERLANPPTGIKSPTKELWQRIAKVEAPDAGTVKLTLERPIGWILDLMADNIGGIVSKNQVSKDQKALLQKGMGAGPFKFKSWDHGTGTELVKNENYYLKGKPYLDGIRGIVIPDAATEVAALRTGQVLFTGQGTRGLTVSESKIVEKDLPGIKLVRYRSTTRQEFFLNSQKKPFTDVRVRRALLMVLDQQAAIDLGYEGAGFKGGPLPPGKFSLPEAKLKELPPYTGPTAANIEAAKKLLAEAGFANGFSTTFAQGSTPQYEEMQLAISNQLRKIGIDVKVRVLAYPVELRAAAAKGDFDVMQIPKMSSLNDADSYLTAYITDGSDNFGKFSDKTVDELYEKQAAILDVAERKKVTDQLQMRVWELAPSWTVLWPQYIAAANPKVKGWNGMNVLRQNLEYDHIWLAK
ncbi:MAG: ABC transporter substrate-binding protein [Chloroflexota bacterium]